MGRRDRSLAAVVALVISVVLGALRGHADWGPSEGVYALSSRLFLDGGDLYGGLVASQPPWVYLFGAAVLAVHDSLDALRFACGVLQVVAAVLAAECVFRLTRNRIAAIVAAPLVILTPWATHQHGLLLPEQLGAPLLLAAALWASRPATARWAGVAAGVALFTKLPFALPAAAVIAASTNRRTTLAWTAGAVAVQAAVFTLLFGTTFWDQIVVAQLQAGDGGLELQAGPFVQAAWNLAPLLALAAVAVWRAGRSADPALLRVLAYTAVGALVSVATIVKPGTGLNVIVPAEALLVPLAVAGGVWALATPRVRLAPVAVAGAAILMLAQSLSLLADPENPRPFHRPFSREPGWRVISTDAQVDRDVARAKACPPDSVYSGRQLVAMIARRHMPADQPDTFIVDGAQMHEKVKERRLADGPRCP
jgi:hypothetical protein